MLKWKISSIICKIFSKTVIFAEEGKRLMDKRFNVTKKKKKKITPTI